MKDNETPKLYSTKSKVLMALCALLVVAIAVVCIVLLANDKKSDGGDATDVVTETDTETETETDDGEHYKAVDTSVLTEDVSETENTPDTSTETSPADTDKPDDNGIDPSKRSIGEGLYITSIEPYSGPFVEDGSDEEVTNIMAATVKNYGTEPVQLVSISVKYGEDEALFEATTIPVGTSVVILEKNKKQFVEGDFDSAEVTSCIRFIEEPSFHSDVVGVTGADGELIIENVGTEDIENKVAVYYKSVKDGKYFGGITYSATIDSGIAAGNSVIVSARHFRIKDSRLMFVIYD